MAKETSELSQLKNIGPTIEKRLHEVGVYTKRDLRALGAVQSYQRIRTNSPGQTMSVCYYLYSLQGALMGLHWDDLPERLKAELRRKAGV